MKRIKCEKEKMQENFYRFNNFSDKKKIEVRILKVGDV